MKRTPRGLPVRSPQDHDFYFEQCFPLAWRIAFEKVEVTRG